MAVNESRIEQLYHRFVDGFLGELGSDEFYAFFLNAIKSGDNTVSLVEKFVERNIDMRWVEIIENTIIPLDNIIRNPQRFIRNEEEVVPIEMVRQVSTDSIRHLAQHTSLIAKVDGDEVTPERMLNITKEESFDTYENRFVYTLLHKLGYFLDKRLDSLVQGKDVADRFEWKMDGTFSAGNDRLRYEMNMSFESPHASVSEMDLLVQADTSQLNAMQRIERVRKILYNFMSSQFVRNLSGCALVRPPLKITNVLAKNQNFRKAVDLWVFIESYDEAGYTIDHIERQGEPNEAYLQVMFSIIALQYVVMKQNSGNARDIADYAARKKENETRIIRRNMDEFIDSFDLEIDEVKRIFVEHVDSRKRKQRAQFKIARDILSRAIVLDKKRFAEEQEREKERARLAKEREERRRERIRAQIEEKERLREEQRAERLRLSEEKKEEQRKKREEAAALRAEERERLRAAAREEKERLREEQRAERERLRAIERLEREKQRELEKKHRDQLARRRAAYKRKKAEKARLIAEEEKLVHELALASVAEEARREREEQLQEPAPMPETEPVMEAEPAPMPEIMPVSEEEQAPMSEEKPVSEEEPVPMPEEGPEPEPIAEEEPVEEEPVEEEPVEQTPVPVRTVEAEVPVPAERVEVEVPVPVIALELRRKSLWERLKEFFRRRRRKREANAERSQAELQAEEEELRQLRLEAEALEAEEEEDDEPLSPEEAAEVAEVLEVDDEVLEELARSDAESEQWVRRTMRRVANQTKRKKKQYDPSRKKPRYKKRLARKMKMQSDPSYGKGNPHKKGK